MTLRSQGFYVTLPSNASLNVFKNNTSSSFREDLAQYLYLDGPWEVAVIKISYPYTWFNLPNDMAYFEWRKKSDAEQKPADVDKQKIFFYGFYEDPNMLRSQIDDACLRRIEFDIFLKYNPIQKKSEFSSGGIYHLRVYPPPPPCIYAWCHTRGLVNFRAQVCPVSRGYNGWLLPFLLLF